MEDLTVGTDQELALLYTQRDMILKQVQSLMEEAALKRGLPVLALSTRHTSREIADLLGITQQRVCQIITTLTKKFRDRCQHDKPVGGHCIYRSCVNFAGRFKLPEQWCPNDGSQLNWTDHTTGTCPRCGDEWTAWEELYTDDEAPAHEEAVPGVPVQEGQPGR